MQEFTDFNDIYSALNEENKQLNEQNSILKQQLEQLVDEIEEQSVRRNLLKQSLESAKTELAEATTLVQEKEQEVEEEEHQKDLNLRQLGKLKELYNSMKKQTADVDERISELQNHLFRRKEEIDALKASFQLNQVEYDNWQVVLKQKMADIEAIAKYSSDDASHIRDLQMNLERMQKELSARKAELDQEITSTQSLQIELDKTSSDYTEIEKTRDNMVAELERLAEAMVARDQLINQNKETYEHNQLHMERIKKDLASKKDILTQHQKTTKELEAKTSQLDTNLQRLLLEHQEVQANQQNAAEEVTSQQNILAKGQIDLNQAQARISLVKRELEDREKAQEVHERRLEMKKEELKVVEDDTKSKEEQSAQIEKLLAEQEARLAQANKELKELKDEIFKQSQLLFKVSQDKSTAIAEINGADTSLKNLNAKIKKLDAESLQQNELIYHADFQIQLMERKIPRAMGERSDEEKQVLDARRKQLEQDVDKLKKQCVTLNSQVKALDEHHHEVTLAIEKKQNEKKRIESNIADLKLANENTVRALSASKTEKEDLAVQEDVLALETKKLTEIFHQRHSEVVTLKNRQQQLQLTIRERQAEISAANDVLRAELRSVEEERHRIALELNDRNLKVERLKQKYASVAGVVEGTDGTSPHSAESAESHALTFVKAAQRRQELEARGDELDQEVKKKQKELLQLERTIERLAQSNADYRQSFKTVNASSQDLEEKAACEEELREAQEHLRAKQRELVETQELSAYQERMLAESGEELSVLRRETEEHKFRREQLEKEIAQQLPKLERAEKQLQKMSQDHRAKHGMSGTTASASSFAETPTADDTEPDPNETQIEREFQYDELRETNNLMLTSLLQIGQQDPNIQSTLDQLLKQHNISTRGIILAPQAQSRNMPLSTSASSAVRHGSRPSSSSGAAPSSSGAPRTPSHASPGGLTIGSPSGHSPSTASGPHAPVVVNRNTRPGDRPPSSSAKSALVTTPAGGRGGSGSRSGSSRASNGSPTNPHAAASSSSIASSLTATRVTPSTLRQPSSRPTSAGRGATNTAKAQGVTGTPSSRGASPHTRSQPGTPKASSSSSTSSTSSHAASPRPSSARSTSSQRAGSRGRTPPTSPSAAKTSNGSRPSSRHASPSAAGH